MKIKNLAAALLGISIVPVLAMSVSAANDTITAYYTEEAVSVDGKVSEAAYILSGELADNTRLGITYDSDSIYVAAILEDEYSTLGLTFGDTSVIYDIENKAFGNGDSVFSAAVYKNTVELKLDFDSLGISFLPCDIVCDFGACFTKDGAEYTLSEKKLEMIYATPISLDSCEDFSSIGYENKDSKYKASNVFLGQSGNTVSAYAFTSSDDNTVLGVDNITRSSKGFTNGDLVVDMNLKVNDLPVVSVQSLTGWNGFCFEMSNTVRRRVSFTADEEGNILCTVLYKNPSDVNGSSVSVDIGKDIGDEFFFRGKYDPDNNLEIYIDGTLVHTFEKVDMQTNYERSFYSLSVYYCDITSGSVNVEMKDFALYTPNDPLEGFTFEMIKGQNTSEANITDSLVLSKNIDIKGVTCPVVWESSDENIIANDGTVAENAANAGKSVTLTAKVDIGGKEYTKEFCVTVAKNLVRPIVSAYYNSDEITVDGNVSESVKLMNAEIAGTDAVAGLSWNTSGVALGVDLGSGIYDSLRFTFGSVSFAYSITDGAFAEEITGVSCAANGNILEFFFDYASLGTEFSAMERKFDFAVTLTSADTSYSTTESKVSLICREIKTADNCDSYEDAGYKAYTKYGTYSDLVLEDGTSSYVIKYDSSKTMIYGIGRSAAGLITAPYDYEMTVKVNDLPVVSPYKLSGWYGFAFDISNTIRLRSSLTKDVNGKIWYNALYYDASDSNGYTQSIDTGKVLGDTFSVRVSFDADYVPTIYIDGKEIGKLPAIDYPGKNSHTYYEIQIGYSDVESGTFDMELLDISMSAPVQLLEKITFDTIKGENSEADSVFTDLSLPDAVTFGDTDVEIPLTWKSSDESVMTSDGVPTYGLNTSGKSITMTATAISGGVTLTKSFDLTVKFETVDKELYYLRNDLNPYNGALNVTNVNFDYKFDANYNSVGLDLGEKTRINTVTLCDSDNTSKIHSSDVSLYVSDDNKEYTKVTDFTLFRSADKLYFSDFETEARFVKVHCHINSNEYISFENKLADIISAGYETELCGNGTGSFENIGSFTLKASKDNNDGTAYVKFSDMALADGVLCEDKRDIRFVERSTGELLRYFLDESGAYIRIPKAVKDVKTTIDVYGGNESAQSLSDADAVFEITYGTKTVMDLTAPGFNHCISTVRCPNGDIFAVGTEEIVKHKMTSRRSTDGGRTWSDPIIFWDDGRHADGCAFLVDGNRMWAIFHIRPKTATIYTLNVAILYSEDNGYTWRNPADESDYPYLPAGNNTDSETYCDGIKLQSYDGDGPGVDYIFSYAHSTPMVYNDFKASVMYSVDDGKTWVSSESNISYDDGSEAAFESGISEASVVELPDGTVKLYCRVQYEGNLLLGESTSYDHGVTWTENVEFTEIYSPNTFPVLKNFGDDVLLLWAGNNTQGGKSYYRSPLNLALSTDGMKTWSKKYDLWSGTSEGTIKRTSHKGTQPKLTFNNYKGSDDMIVAWWDYLNYRNKMILIEDAAEFVYNTKGAGDDFETTSTLYEGWDAIGGSLGITDEKASSGSHSMKISDVSKTITRVSRSVPEMYDGEISFDVNLANADTGFYMEFKSAMSTEFYTADRFALCIEADGSVKSVDAKKKDVYETLGNITLDEWHRVSVIFDINAGAAKLYIDGEEAGELPVNASVYGGICFIHLCDGSSSGSGLEVYIDNFRAYEGTSFELCADEEETSEKEVIFNVTFNREEGSTPYVDEDYDNRAKMYIYTSESKEELVDTIIIESADTASNTCERKILLNSGNYYAEIVKNGYKKYDFSFSVAENGATLPEIKLTGGDIIAALGDECGDGKVDIDDFIRVLRGFDHNADDVVRKAVDINEDGTVNVGDLAVIKANFGK